MKKIYLFGFLAIVSTLVAVGVGTTVFKPAESVASIDNTDPKYQNTYLDVPSEGKPSDYSAVDNLFIAQEVFKEKQYKTVETKGEVVASVLGINYNQTVINRKNINDNEAFQEALSLSALKKVGEQRYVTDNSFLVRKGKNVSENGANWQQVNSLTKDKYYELYGYSPFELTGYVLNSMTINSSEVIEQNSNYVYKYILDTEIAPIKNARETKTLGDASSLPVYSSCAIEVTMNDKWEVSKVVGYDVYDIAIMGGLTCKSTLTNIYTYHNEEILIPERDDFAPYFGSEGNDNIEEVLDGSYYLNDALQNMMLGDAINLNAKININDYPLDIHAYLDIKNSDIKLNINDFITVYYLDNNLYLNFNNIFGKVSADELMDVINMYYPIGEFSLDNLLDNDFMQNLLSNMKENISSNACNLTFALPEGSIQLNLDIKDKKATFDNATFSIDLLDFKIDGNINFNGENYNYKKLPDNVEEFTSIKDNIISIQEFLKKKNFNVSLSFNYENINVNVDSYVYYDFETLKLDANINLEFDNQEILLNLKYYDDYLFLSYGDNLCIRLSPYEINTLFNMVSNVFGIDNPVDNIEIADVDFTNLLQSITCNIDGLSARLDLSTFGLNRVVNLYYLRGQGIKAESNELLDLEIVNCEYKDIIVPTDYIGMTDISQYFMQIYKLMNNHSLSLDVNYFGKINNVSMSLVGKGQVYIGDFKNILNSIKFSFEGQVAINDQINIDLYIEYINHNIKLCIDDEIINLKDNELLEIINYANEKLNLGLNSLENNISAFDINNILKSIHFDNNGLYFQNELFTIGLNKNGSLNIDLGNGNFINAKIESEIHDIVGIEEQATISKDVLYRTIDLISKMQNISDFKNLNINLNLNLENILIDGNIYLNISDNLKITAQGKIALLYNNETIYIDITYIDDTIYVSYEDNINIKLTTDELLNLVSYVENKFGLNINVPELSFELSKISIGDLISSLSADNDNLILKLDLNSLGIKPLLTLNYDFTSDQIIIDAGNIKATICKTEFKDISVNQNCFYLTYDEICSYVDLIEYALNSKQISINDFALSIKVNDQYLLIDGNVIISFVDILKIEGQVSLLYQNMNLDIDFTVIGDKVYVSLGSINLSLSVNEIGLLINEIEDAFNLSFNINFNQLNDSLSSLSNVSINSILRMISITENQITINGNFEGFGNIIAKINSNGNIYVETIYGTINASIISNYEINEPTYIETLTYKDFSKLISTIADALAYQNYNAFTFTFNGIYNDVDFSGSLRFILNETLIDTLNIQVVANESIGRSHNINLTLVDGKYYIDYNELRAYVDNGSLYQLIRYINDLTIKNSLVDDILEDFTDGISIDVVDKLPSTGTIHLNDYISHLRIFDNEFDLGLNIFNDTYRITFGSDESNLLHLGIMANDLSLIAETTDFNADIVTPNIDGRFNFSSLDEFVKTAINTINLRRYQIPMTNFTASIIGIKINAQIALDAIIDENNVPTVVIKLNVPQFLGCVDKGTENVIVYDGNNVYVKRYWTKKVFGIVSSKGTDYRLFTKEDLMNDPMELIYHCVIFTSLVENQIKEALSSTPTDGNNGYMDFDKIIQNYSYDETLGKYDMALDGCELTQNQDINSLTVSLTKHPNQDIFNQLSVSLAVIDIISLSLNATLNDLDDSYFVEIPSWVNENF